MIIETAHMTNVLNIFPVNNITCINLLTFCLHKINMFLNSFCILLEPFCLINLQWIMHLLCLIWEISNVIFHFNVGLLLKKYLFSLDNLITYLCIKHGIDVKFLRTSIFSFSALTSSFPNSNGLNSNTFLSLASFSCV